jgi:hypothetical protein
VVKYPPDYRASHPKFYLSSEYIDHLNKYQLSEKVQHLVFRWSYSERGLTVKLANSPQCDCHGSTGLKHQYGLMMLAYQCFITVLLLIYGSLFLRVVWCAVARMSEILVKLGKSGSESERC